jgi:hypothetical protein
MSVMLSKGWKPNVFFHVAAAFCFSLNAMLIVASKSICSSVPGCGADPARQARSRAAACDHPWWHGNQFGLVYCPRSPLGRGGQPLRQLLKSTQAGRLRGNSATPTESLRTPSTLHGCVDRARKSFGNARGRDVAYATLATCAPACGMS